VPDTRQVAAVPSKASAADDEDDWDADDVEDLENVTLYRLNTSIWRMTPRRKVVEVGQKLLKDNHIRQTISFSVQSQTNTVNAYASATSHSVFVTTDLLRHLSSDDELAAILGHEIG